MNGNLCWAYMVNFLAGDLHDEMTTLVIADTLANNLGKVTRRKAKS